MSHLLKTPWYIAPVVDFPSRKAMVIGAGLAGCFIAHALAQRGWEVTIFDEYTSPGRGASGNRQAVLYPQFSAYHSPLIDFMLSAYLFAQRLYRPLVGQAFDGDLNGILQLATTTRKIAAHERLASWLEVYSDLGRLVDADEASQLAGVRMKSGGLYVSHSGWIDSQSLCEYLIQHPLIRFCGQQSIDNLSHHDHHWVIHHDAAPVLIIANGYAANSFDQTHWLPIRAVAGQMTYFRSNAVSERLQIPICGQGHILPMRYHAHAFGATYHLNTRSFTPQTIDDLINAQRLQELPIDVDWDLKPIDHWSGIRAAAPDYLPLVGPVAKVESFNQIYKGLAADSRHHIAGLADHYPGLYVMTGFGSRGLTTVPLASEILAGMIHAEPTSYPNSMLAALSPSRFLRQGLISCKNKA